MRAMPSRGRADFLESPRNRAGCRPQSARRGDAPGWPQTRTGRPTTFAEIGGGVGAARSHGALGICRRDVGWHCVNAQRERYRSRYGILRRASDSVYQRRPEHLSKRSSPSLAASRALLATALRKRIEFPLLRPHIGSSYFPPVDGESWNRALRRRDGFVYTPVDVRQRSPASRDCQ